MTGQTRRDFLKKTGKGAMAFLLPGSLVSGCAGLGTGNQSLEETLRSIQYAKAIEQWDPIYGPPIQWYSRYKGPGDFKGHIRGRAVPGIDYDVPKGTPLVTPMASYLREIEKDRNGSLYILLYNVFNPSYRISFGHLDDIWVDENYVVLGDVMKYLGKPTRALGREEKIALSGNSGKGPREYGGIQPPHLHLSFFFYDAKVRKWVDLDPEKFGIDGGRPTFWDGDTLLDMKASHRLSWLEKALTNFNKEVEGWPDVKDLSELKGTLIDLNSFIRDMKGKAILDSKYFQDMRSLLKRITLEEKKYTPGTKPYQLMLKILGYSTDERQEVILTLPFIAPNLEKIYKRPIFEQGNFFNISSTQE